MSGDWMEAVGVLVIVASASTSSVAGAIALHRRRKRQGVLHDAEDALARAGFSVARVLELGQPRDAWDVREQVTLSLRGALDERVTFTLGWAHDAAEGALRISGLAVVKRATFAIGREDAMTRLARRVGLSDIEIGDARLDDALKLSGWPVDIVRGVIAAPGVRAPLSRLFQSASVQHARVAPVSDAFGNRAAQGALTVAWRLPWERVAELRALSDDALALAVALDDARWAEPRPEPTGTATGAAGPSSGLPFGVPGVGER